ncbi:MAG: Hvo_1808 family surface protein [Halobacteriaceae archaeon]
MAVVLVASLLCAGCGGFIGVSTPDTPTPDEGPQTTVGTGDRTDPDTDVLGWEGGVWHNESIAVDQSDGLSDAELARYVARGMARVEYIRDLEFKSMVPVEVMSRAEYRNRSQGGGSNGPSTYQRWNEQVWEALWILGENATFAEALGATRGSSVAGFYSPSKDRITIITPTPESPTISSGTLIHELTHAIQDQYGYLGRSSLVRSTQDGQLAADSLVEGEANYVQDRYGMRCGGAWNCVASPSEGSGGSLPPDFNFGVFVTIFFPYSDGPPWVASRVDTAGWQAISAAYDSPPVSTEQVIHVTNETPMTLSFTDTSTDAWSMYPNYGERGADTVGEASIFTMFWYQSRNYDAGVVPVNALGDTESPYDAYRYVSSPSEGWGNDLVVPYRNGSGGDGYVWKTIWDTEADAREFARAYRAVLAAHDARSTGQNTYVVPSGPFADAFRVVREGQRVTIVNAPTVEALADLRPNVSAPGTPTRTTRATSGATGPGLGIGTVVVAAVVTALLLGARAHRD